MGSSVLCNDCNAEYLPGSRGHVCPSCGSVNFRSSELVAVVNLIGGHTDSKITFVRAEEEQPRLVVTFKSDGTYELGEGVTVEQALAFVAKMMAPQIMKEGAG